MKTKSAFISLILTLSLLLALSGSPVVGTATPVAAGPAPHIVSEDRGDIPVAGILAEWHVCPAGPPDCDFTIVQEAVDAAGDGDIIKVAAGTYHDMNAHGGLAQMLYISKTVDVIGGYTTADWVNPDPTANPTILDAQQMGRVVYITGSITPTLEGFHVTGGDATGLGGGLHNYDGVGGGIYVVNAPANIQYCSIYDNLATSVGWGGGGDSIFGRVLA